MGAETVRRDLHRSGEMKAALCKYLIYVHVQMIDMTALSPILACRIWEIPSERGDRIGGGHGPRCSGRAIPSQSVHVQISMSHGCTKTCRAANMNHVRIVFWQTVLCKPFEMTVEGHDSRMFPSLVSSSIGFAD